MIVPADEKAALAWLDLISVQVASHDPHAIAGACAGAIEFYRSLHPTTADEFEAIGVGIDAIAAAQIHALGLLALGDLG